MEENKKEPLFVGSEEFLDSAKRNVYKMAKEGLDPSDNVKFGLSDVYVVSYAFVLWEHKALLSTNLPDGKYYEVTFNKDTHEMYIDCYVRLNQKKIEFYRP